MNPTAAVLRLFLPLLLLPPPLWLGGQRLRVCVWPALAGRKRCPQQPSGCACPPPQSRAQGWTLPASVPASPTLAAAARVVGWAGGCRRQGRLIGRAGVTMQYASVARAACQRPRYLASLIATSPAARPCSPLGPLPARSSPSSPLPLSRMPPARCCRQAAAGGGSLIPARKSHRTTQQHPLYYSAATGGGNAQSEGL